ncbi:MAG: HEAT repeat domain-containing protein [Polyangiales bacterium]
MKPRSTMRLAALELVLAQLVFAAPAPAQDADPPAMVYDRERGELSPGTAAPKREQMLNAIKSAGATRLQATLEYGERVECFECIPALADKLLGSSDPRVREIAAWWLRRRTFGIGKVMRQMQSVAREDSDPVRRARAAAALGEFLDPHAAPVLAELAERDADEAVRAEAVRALGRLNVPAGHTGLSAGLRDRASSVRLAALQQLTRINFFHDPDVLLSLLADPDEAVRRSAVQLAGELRLVAATDVVLGILVTDDSARVRQAAAFSAGRLGGADAARLLADAAESERDPGVLDAIAVARRLTAR